MPPSANITAHTRGLIVQRRLLWIFGLQWLGVALVSVLGYFHIVPFAVVLALIVVISALACLAAHRLWHPVSRLARMVNGWHDGHVDLDAFQNAALLNQPNQEIAQLTRSFHRFASRISGYNERERNFTRDASHELRSPLTVIKMSTDMLADEPSVSEFGQRSLERIRRATREMEALVEAMLILARELDNGQSELDFLVNDVLREELVDARELLHGHPVELKLEENAQFGLHGSPRVFAVLCWQLIRHASQYTGQGTVVVCIEHGAISVAATAGADHDPHIPGQQGFEYAIARRISERFGWTLDLHAQGGNSYVAEIRFPRVLPA